VLLVVLALLGAMALGVPVLAELAHGG